jgi:hypothetical protein
MNPRPRIAATAITSAIAVRAEPWSAGAASIDRVMMSSSPAPFDSSVESHALVVQNYAPIHRDMPTAAQQKPASCLPKRDNQIGHQWNGCFKMAKTPTLSRICHNGSKWCIATELLRPS